MIETPILDGIEPLPARKVRWGLALLVGFALGGVLIALDRSRSSPDPLIPPQAFVIFLPVLYVAVLAHELGHLVAGMMVGFEPRQFMVGAFLFDKEASGWRFRFVSRHLFGGRTAVIPRSNEDLVHRYIRVVLGGPVASLVLLIVTLLLPSGLSTRVLFWVNLLLTISVCIPYTVVGFPNDAKLILLLMRKGGVGERLIAILHLMVLDAQGKQPREWPSQFIEKLEVRTKDNSRMPAALGLLLADAAEKEDAQRMAEILERALAMNNKISPDAQREFLTVASCYHGFHHGDASRAEEWLKRARSVKSGRSQKDWDSEALAAISYAKGDYAQSAESLARYIALLDRQPVGGMVTAEQARLNRLLVQLTARV